MTTGLVTDWEAHFARWARGQRTIDAIFRWAATFFGVFLKLAPANVVRLAKCVRSGPI